MFGSNKIIIPMLIEIGPEFQCLERSDKKTNVYKKGPDFQCLEG